MTNYVKSTNFASKDALAQGNPLKIVKGTEIDAEFNNIATAVATKADTASPTFTGVVTAPSFTGNLTGNVTGNVTGNINGNVTGNVSAGAGTISTTTWSISEVGGILYFKSGGVSKAKLDASGNLTVVGNITAYGTV